jgi:hypothetical protein
MAGKFGTFVGDRSKCSGSFFRFFHPPPEIGNEHFSEALDDISTGSEGASPCLVENENKDDWRPVRGTSESLRMCQWVHSRRT